MLHHLRPALVMTLVLTLLLGLAYPLAITGIAGLIAPAAAEGSLIRRDGKVIGSTLLAQGFSGAGYLHPRPSASDYIASGSFGSNLSPLNPDLIATAAARREAWHAANGGEAPIDAVTASGSGLDPHISPANALGQAARIGLARGMAVEAVQQIIAEQTEGAWLGLYGAPRVNVLAVNLALDVAQPMPPAGGS